MFMNLCIKFRVSSAKGEFARGNKDFKDFIVQTNKRFLLFLVQQKISKTRHQDKLGFSYTFFLENEAQTREKKIQGNVFLLIWRSHAKIQTFLKKKIMQIFHLA